MCIETAQKEAAYRARGKAVDIGYYHCVPPGTLERHSLVSSGVSSKSDRIFPALSQMSAGGEHGH